MRVLAVLALLGAGVAGLPAQTSSRLELIQRRGSLGCGIEPVVAGFSEVGPDGRYRGLDVDVCRAMSAAIFGTPDKVTFIPVRTVTEFARNHDIDVVSRRLTWELRREHPLGLLFGPITFYDGQGFLVPKRLGITSASELSAVDLCVAGGTVFELTANAYFTAYRKIVLESPHAYQDIASALATGRCQAYTGDVSDLGAIRILLARPDDFVILSEHISKEPLAPLVRDDDPQWFDVVRWTIFALINAEELGVTSKNVDEMRESANLDVRRLLGTVPGNGAALGLTEHWAYDAIKSVGNYGEMFDRNLGRDSRLQLERGLNRLSTDGGLMYAPPLR